MEDEDDVLNARLPAVRAGEGSIGGSWHVRIGGEGSGGDESQAGPVTSDESKHLPGEGKKGLREKQRWKEIESPE